MWKRRWPSTLCRVGTRKLTRLRSSPQAGSEFLKVVHIGQISPTKSVPLGYLSRRDSRSPGRGDIFVSNLVNFTSKSHNSSRYSRPVDVLPAPSGSGLLVSD